MPTAAALPIFDGHNDTLLRLYREAGGDPQIFLTGTPDGHIDLPRARAGGFGGGFFAIFVPPEPGTVPPVGSDLIITAHGYEVVMAPPIDPAYAQRVTIAVAAGLFRLEAAAGGQVKVVHTAAELQACLDTGVLAVVLHFEGAEAIDPGLGALDVFYAAGLRSLGLVWSRPNIFATGVPFQFPRSPDTGPGLTGAGRDLVRGCNQLGVMIDLAHLNEQGFWDVARLSDAPLVATHTAAHALCASTRNLTDRQLDAVSASGGVVGLNFHVSDLRADGHLDADVPITAIVRHIDYLVDRMGIDHVAFGSDFDGATMPLELSDVSKLPNLLAGLRSRGYDIGALAKLTSQNWVRVLRATWRET